MDVALESNAMLRKFASPRTPAEISAEDHPLLKALFARIKAEFNNRDVLEQATFINNIKEHVEKLTENVKV